MLFLGSIFCGVGEQVELEEVTDLDHDEAEEELDEADFSQDPSAVRFVNILMELGTDKLFKEWVLCPKIFTISFPLNCPPRSPHSVSLQQLCTVTSPSSSNVSIYTMFILFS